MILNAIWSKKARANFPSTKKMHGKNHYNFCHASVFHLTSRGNQVLQSRMKTEQFFFSNCEKQSLFKVKFKNLTTKQRKNFLRF